MGLFLTFVLPILKTANKEVGGGGYINAPIQFLPSHEHDLAKTFPSHFNDVWFSDGFKLIAFSFQCRPVLLQFSASLGQKQKTLKG